MRFSQTQVLPRGGEEQSEQLGSRETALTCSRRRWSQVKPAPGAFGARPAPWSPGGVGRGWCPGCRRMAGCH